MTIAFFFKSQAVNNFFYFPLIQNEYEVKSFVQTEPLLEYLEKKECHLLVMDYDDFMPDSEDILARIRLVSEKLQIVLVTFLSSFLVRQVLIKYKIYGVVAKPISYPKLLEEARQYLELLEKNPSRTLRKHPRVHIEKKENNLVKLIFKDIQASYLGAAEDISLGGMGITLKKEASQYILFKGKKFEGMAELENLKFDFKGDIANFKGKTRLGITFAEIKPQDLAKIKNFILHRMLEEKK